MGTDSRQEVVFSGDSSANVIVWSAKHFEILHTVSYPKMVFSSFHFLPSLLSSLLPSLLPSLFLPLSSSSLFLPLSSLPLSHNNNKNKKKGSIRALAWHDRHLWVGGAKENIILLKKKMKTHGARRASVMAPAKRNSILALPSFNEEKLEISLSASREV